MNAKVKILDNGKCNNWVNADGGNFKLYVDGEYIGAVNVENNTVIIVSTLHRVELRGYA